MPCCGTQTPLGIQGQSLSIVQEVFERLHRFWSQVSCNFLNASTGSLIGPSSGPLKHRLVVNTWFGRGGGLSVLILMCGDYFPPLLEMGKMFNCGTPALGITSTIFG